MTDNEIIKALKELLEVMLYEGDLQRASTISNTIDHINRQQTEIERYEKSFAEVLKSIKEVQILVVKDIAKAKAEAVKEFADRLLDKAIATSNYFQIKSLVTTVAKEMGGDKKMSFCWFIFEDGYRVFTRGFSKQELAVEERIHGKLISKEAE